MKVLCQEVSELHLIGKKFCVEISATGLSYDFEKFGKCRVQELGGHSNPRIAFFRLQRQVDQNSNVKGLCSLCPIYQKHFWGSTVWYEIHNLMDFFSESIPFFFYLANLEMINLLYSSWSNFLKVSKSRKKLWWSQFYRSA